MNTRLHIRLMEIAMTTLFDKLLMKKPNIPILVLLGLGLTGCSIITIDTMRNEPLIVPQVTTANGHSRYGDEVFIGIAMSGGGSRASNFSAAVLLEMDKLGILKHTDVISSVSGSSLTAAYYGLYGDNKDPAHPWHEEGVRKAFLIDLQSSWLIDWLKPWNIARYWLSNFTRSDIMIAKLNEELFDDYQFKRLIGNTPQILINATSYTNGQPFIFTEDYFASRLNSRLDTYPVANAVMASSAFPGVFHPVTVKDYSIQDRQKLLFDPNSDYYEHLIDGGPYDNLGVTTIANILQKQKPKHCLLLVVDAYPYPVSANDIQKADTRNVADYVFDSGTVVSSTDIMLARNRKLIMEKAINFDPQDIGFKAYNPNSTIKFPAAMAANSSDENSQDCAVWHLSFQRMHDQQFEWTYARRNINKLQFLDRVRKAANSIPTRYQLSESQDGDSPETVQDFLFKAAEILVRQDKECNQSDNECKNDKFTYQKVCDLLVRDWKLNDIAAKCR